ncbi:NAD(+) synthase [Pelovirga terrestris]|uniref:Glutamine-dependent NAD(+) synthetase n=1 Tax=Pelovirga terrestris TaxID=2771352 RepID=A0A8J6UR00_9BACT|nr:NAD(+) synthase [Pelovirga terrestris]MBD1400156.1 NAD(+) synthase [Pelovirga terrestris]
MTNKATATAIDPIPYGLVRVAAATPQLHLADPDANLGEICNLAQRAAEQSCSLVVFPELCLTGYSCGDLFFQELLQRRVVEVLFALGKWTTTTDIAIVVGLPLAVAGRLFNCAALISAGIVHGLVPKTHLPNTGEFYEQRWFSSARDANWSTVTLRGVDIPFGTDLLFAAADDPQMMIGIELCEDLWAVQPPSGSQALAGASLLLNLSASPEILGKFEYRRNLVASQSARCLAAYVYAGSGPGESSTDLVFPGHSLIAENGQIFAETERFSFESQLAVADLDVARLQSERQRNRPFAESAPEGPSRVISVPLHRHPISGLLRPLARTPFVPPDLAERRERCHEIFQIQTGGLVRRLRHTGSRAVVIGISGGLDSTLALLVTVKTFDLAGLPRTGIVAVTMPGFGTTSRTRSNAQRLAEELGVTLRVIPIDAAVEQHFRDIGHDPKVHDVTYENSQARERTQILMDIANQVSGLVIGTGDLSELALGWCTYNGDHMSMYAVNGGVPKTLVRYLVQWCADEEFSGETSTVLGDVCATPISPELLPPSADGEIEQLTEQVIGPYLVHDFFLYQVVRMHFSPQKVLMLAEQAFVEEYSRSQLIDWLKQFYRRFFSQQFKRSCLPDGPKVGTVALSPRGDWRMPSDAAAALWLAQLEQLQ